MKKNFLFIIFFSTLSIVLNIAHADKFDEIKKSGVIRAAVFDSNPPFGHINAKTKQIIGYDVDIANAIAQSLGVRVEFLATNPANRIPLLKSQKVDLIVANFTITPERAKEIEFSIPYFSTGQKFIARKDVLKTESDINTLRIGADKGTVQEITLRERYPSAIVISYDDTPQAFAALRNRNVQAITQDDAKLVGLLANLPEAIRKEFELSPFSITQEYQGIAVLKGENRLIEAINRALIELEKSGKAETIYNSWFGPATKTAQPRGNFKFGVHS